MKLLFVRVALGVGDARERANRVLKVIGAREEIAGWAPTIAPPAPHEAFVVRVALGDARDERIGRCACGGANSPAWNQPGDPLQRRKKRPNRPLKVPLS